MVSGWLNVTSSNRCIGLDFLKTAFKAFAADETNSNNIINNSINSDNSKPVLKREEMIKTKRKLPRINEKESELVKLRDLCKKRRFDVIINQYMMKNMGKPFTDPDTDFAEYQFFLLAFSHKAQVQNLLKCFKELQEKTHKPIPYTYSDIVIHSLLHTGRLKEALSLLEEMKNLNNIMLEGPSNSTYVLFLEHYAKEGDAHAALEMLESVHTTCSLKKLNKLPREQRTKEVVTPCFLMFKSVLGLLTEQGKMKLASHYLFLMTKFYKHEANGPIYEMFVKGFANLGDFNSAKSYIELIRNLIKSNQASSDSLRSAYVSLISSVCKKTDMALAEELMKEFSNEGFKSDIATANCFIEGYAQTGNIQAALDIYQKMKDTKTFVSPKSYTILITYFTKLGNFLMASKLLESAILDFKNEKGNEEYVNMCYNFLLRGYMENGKLQLAINLFDKMKSMGILITPYTYHSLINGFCKNQDPERALEILKEMERNNVKPEIYAFTPIIQSLLQSSSLTNASMFLEYAFKTYNFTPTYYIFCMFMQYGTIRKRPDIFEKYYRLGLKYGKTSSENAVYFFNQAVQHYVMNNYSDKAEGVLTDMNELLAQPDDTTHLFIAVGFMINTSPNAKKYLRLISTYQDTAGDEITLADYTFVLKELETRKCMALANRLYYDYLVPLDLLNLDIVHSMMRLNISNFENVELIYQSLPSKKLTPNSTTDELFIQAKLKRDKEEIVRTVSEGVEPESIRVVRF